jgi:hypothetical protein
MTKERKKGIKKNEKKKNKTEWIGTSSSKTKNHSSYLTDLLRLRWKFITFNVYIGIFIINFKIRTFWSCSIF